MRFPYHWRLADGYPSAGLVPHGKRVFSTFACGGGSTMGYKLAGFNVIGANDIDKEMAMIYKKNHDPWHYFLMDIRDLTKKAKEGDLPPELYELDVLDGSPPCSSFSMAGSREKAWGKEKKFREGQADQTLDDLFFRFLDLAEQLKPKVIVAENVKGMLHGKAAQYCKNVFKKFHELGYEVQLFLLNGATMGVPQRRERVFFIARRKELGFPKLALSFDEAPIRFGAFRSEQGKPITDHAAKLMAMRIPSDKSIGDINMRVFKKLSQFTQNIISDGQVCPTVTATAPDHRMIDGMILSDSDYINAGSFPQDYEFCGLGVKYVVGMSVPPVMMAQVAYSIYQQWFK